MASTMVVLPLRVCIVDDDDNVMTVGCDGEGNGGCDNVGLIIGATPYYYWHGLDNCDCATCIQRYAISTHYS